MVGSERVYVFSVPDWRMPFAAVPQGAFCICYQSGLDSNGYGPYGFNTANAKELLCMLAEGAFYYDVISGEVVPAQTLGAVGFYIFNLSLSMEVEIVEYEKLRKKSILFQRYGKDVLSPISKPKVLEVFESGHLVIGESETDILEHIFIRNNYAPEAGASLILFGSKIRVKVKDFCDKFGVEYVVAESIDKLKAW